MRKYDIINEVGNIYGRWIVLEYAGKYKDGCIGWLCHCTCGVEKIVNGKSLRAGESKSCGCAVREVTAKRTFIDLTGQVFGRLTVLQRVLNKKKATAYLCRCICGKEVEVRAGHLKLGTARSCGCFRQEMISRRGKDHPNWVGAPKYKDGYVYIYHPEHLNALTDGYVAEHIYVMSQIIGRPLIKGETVHHKNGVRDDNAPDNLELRASNHGPGQRITDLVPYWKKMLEVYEPIVNKL